MTNQMSYQQGYADGVRATKAEFLKLHQEELDIQDELLDALTRLLKACNNADVNGELSEFIDGSLLGDAEEIIAKAKGESHE